MTAIIAVVLAGIFVLVVLPQVILYVAVQLRTPSVHRIPFPAERALTVQDAIAMSKEALSRDGKASVNMRPVPIGHKDEAGRDIIFGRNKNDTDGGYIVWWIDDPQKTWQYRVGLARDGDSIVCTIVTPL